MDLHGNDPIRPNVVVGGTVLEQYFNFEYLGYNMSYIIDNDIMNKRQKVQPYV